MSIDLAVVSLEDGAEEAPRERVGEREPAGGRSLEEDVHQRDGGQPAGARGQDPVQPPPDPPGGRRERDDEDGRAADSEEEQREVEEPAGDEEDVDGLRGPGERVDGDVRGDTPRSITWNTKAPEIGSESAETTRQATV